MNSIGITGSLLALTKVVFGVASTVSMALLCGQTGSEKGNLVGLDFLEASWYLNEVSTALIFVDSQSTPVVELPEDSDEIRFLNTEVVELVGDDRGSYVVSLRFLPLRTGVRSFPSFPILLDGERLETPSRQILVGEPHTTEAMSFSIQAAKSRVYVGEPIRLDFVWRCDLPMNQMRELRLSPSFFSSSKLEVVIPRSVVPEEEQFGLPVGGRRVIAHRISKEDTFPPRMGELRFSVFVRFKEPGPFEIPRTRLLCSRLLVENAQSNRYAAYFNNALFEAPDRASPYEKLHAFSDPVTIEALPLPGKDRLESFSGLFGLDSIEVSVRPESAPVGQLMEIRIDVRSAVCSEMLELPDLGRQASLRNRFWVGQDVNEIWKPDGRTFIYRARPLSVETSAFPSLAFQVFDPVEADYRMVRTKPVSLDIFAREGKDYFPIEKIPGAQYLVVGNDDGIWHNLKPAFMTDLLDVLVNALADGVWVFLLVGPALFFGLSLWAREARRRSIDAAYRNRRAAYEQFRKAVSKGEDDAEALRALLAACFERRESALTAKDVARLLGSVRSEAGLAREIEEAIGERDADRYRPASEDAKSLRRTGPLGERVYRLFQRGLVSAILIFFVTNGMDRSHAADWGRAESLFDDALLAAETNLDSDEVEKRFAEAALEFQSCAENGIRAGRSWYNAGNAWFKAGEMGRSIASYRQAQARMPFDGNVADSLQAARALSLDTFSEARTSLRTPSRWQKASFSLLWLGAAVVAAFWVRYRSRLWLTLSAAVFGAALVQGGFLAWGALAGFEEGVLIADEVYGRKGPGYAYLSAYTDPLHDGLELVIVEQRGEWTRARLQDGSECWLPTDTVVVLEL